MAKTSGKINSVGRNHVPYEIEGKLGDSYLGMGVVIDDEKGIVVTERDTVPTYLGDVKLNLFGGSRKNSADILWVHPQKVWSFCNTTSIWSKILR